MSSLIGTILSHLESPSDPVILSRWLEHRLADVHVAMPGKVVAYHAPDNTVDVQPMIGHGVDQPDGTVTPEYPPRLLGVPVCFQRGGGYALTFEVDPGDMVLLVFCERALDLWWDATRGASSVVDLRNTRKHDWSDAVAIPGLLNRTTAKPNPDALKMLLGAEDGSATLKLDRRARSAQLAADRVDLGGLAGQPVGRVGDRVQVLPADNPAFYAWIAAVSAAAASPTPSPVPPFTGPIVGSILTGSGKVKSE